MISESGFVEKIEKLKYEGTIQIADAKCVGLSDEEIDSYIAYKMRDFMRRGEIAFNHVAFYKAENEYIWQHLKLVFPDITKDRFHNIITLMIKNRLVHIRKGFIHSDKIPKRNKQLK